MPDGVLMCRGSVSWNQVLMRGWVRRVLVGCCALMRRVLVRRRPMVCRGVGRV